MHTNAYVYITYIYPHIYIHISTHIHNMHISTHIHAYLQKEAMLAQVRLKEENKKLTREQDNEYAKR